MRYRITKAKSAVFLFAVFGIVLFQVASGIGVIDIKFIRYRSGCGDCDPKFTFCVDRPSSRLTVDRRQCAYKVVGESDYYSNTKDIRFGDSIKGISNPWRTRFRSLQEREIMLVARVRDRDSSVIILDQDDHMTTFGRNLTETVYPTVNEAKYERRTMKKESHELTFDIKIYCTNDYYGWDCGKQCLPPTSSQHYTCDRSTGEKICNEGWTGASCDEDIDECDQNICERGQCTNLAGGYSCTCPEHYSGPTCDIMDDPCKSRPCRNWGNCVSAGIEYSYWCTCWEPYYGPRCEYIRDLCDSGPCLNGGQCINSNDRTTFTCNCVPPFTGDNCEIQPTTAGPTTRSTSTSTTTAPTTRIISTRIVPSSRPTSTTTISETVTSTTTVSTTASDKSTSATTGPTSMSKRAIGAETLSPSVTVWYATTVSSTVSSATNTRSTKPIGGAGQQSVTSEESTGDGFKWWQGLIIGLVVIILLLVLLLVKRSKTKDKDKSPCELPQVNNAMFDGKKVAFDNDMYKGRTPNNDFSGPRYIGTGVVQDMHSADAEADHQYQDLDEIRQDFFSCGVENETRYGTNLNGHGPPQENPYLEPTECSKTDTKSLPSGVYPPKFPVRENTYSNVPPATTAKSSASPLSPQTETTDPYSSINGEEESDLVLAQRIASHRKPNGTESDNPYAEPVNFEGHFHNDREPLQAPGNHSS